jgi:hypothetical protein
MFIFLFLFLLSVAAVQARYVYVSPPAPMCYGSECVGLTVREPSRTNMDLELVYHSGQEVVCPASKEVIIITVCSVIGQGFFLVIPQFIPRV